jgi:hypothetical protein
MAAVLRRQRADEPGPPQRPEARLVADRGETGEQRIDEHRRAHAVDLAHADVVDVGAAGDAALAWHELAVGALRRGLAGGEHVLEPPQHVEGAGPQRLPVGPQPLALLDDALVRADAAVVPAADEEQPSRLVGGEGEADIGCREPCRETLRQQQQRALVAYLPGGNVGHRAIPSCTCRRSAAIEFADHSATWPFDSPYMGLIVHGNSILKICPRCVLRSRRVCGASGGQRDHKDRLAPLAPGRSSNLSAILPIAPPDLMQLFSRHSRARPAARWSPGWPAAARSTPSWSPA